MLNGGKITAHVRIKGTINRTVRYARPTLLRDQLCVATM